MGILYVAAALVVVPALLGAFHLLSRPPRVTSQPGPPALEAPRVIDVDRISAMEWGSVAEEAERWLRSQSNS